MPQVEHLGPFLLLSEAVRSFPMLVAFSWIIGLAISLYLWRHNVTKACLLLTALGVTSALYANRVYPFFSSNKRINIASVDDSFVSIAVVNVEYGRADPQQMRKGFSGSLPDVLVVSELTSEWISQSEFLKEYAYKAEVPGLSAEGIAVYSRYPIESMRKLAAGFFNTLAMDVRLSDVSTVHLIALHAPPPHVDLLFKYRSAYFDFLSHYISDIPIETPLLLAGDFNMTPLSDSYQDFVVKNNLRNIAYGRGLPTTWPMPFLTFTGAYIDQVLYRGGVEGVDLKVLDNFGSDHRPLEARFRFRNILIDK